jgi:hypothetical protein
MSWQGAGKLAEEDEDMSAMQCVPDRVTPFKGKVIGPGHFWFVFAPRPSGTKGMSFLNPYPDDLFISNWVTGYLKSSKGAPFVIFPLSESPPIEVISSLSGRSWG